MSFEENFSKHLNLFQTYPYLFVGSGLSIRYIGSESWSGLLEHMCNSLGFDRPYGYYKSNHDNDLIKVASTLASQFNDKWWSDNAFSESRNDFTNPESSSAPFKYEIAKHLKLKTINTEFKDEIAALKKINIEGIITTNYDTLLETLFPDYKPFIGQENLLFKDMFGVGEIYKIHGCLSDPNSMVLTEEDYKSFEQKNIYLAAKLLTIFVEHPIIFLGYSISDPNIIGIIENIVTCLDTSNIEKLKDRLIFVQWDESITQPEFGEGVISLKGKATLPIKQIKTNSFKPVFETLAKLKARMPIKVLRTLNELICNYVKTNKPSKVKLISNQSELSQLDEIELVYGIGLTDKLGEKGYESIEIIDVYKDILYDNQNYNPEKMVESVIPKMIRGKTYIPFFKYTSKYGTLITDKKLERYNTTISKEDYKSTSSYANKEKEVNKLNSLEELFRTYDAKHCIYYIPLLDETKINLDILKQFLIDNWESIDFSKYTHFKKVVCLYDYYKYKSNHFKIATR